ncbi:hypothetical protein [Variovorax sp. dw_308]|uniref:hypothetical protein n=1 Tax=Variovorax sp. dw_308 TaxID=2721546 RepID=UPI001C49177A|nr:hypothetical protein [Variovorax sp. dw_308]
MSSLFHASTRPGAAARRCRSGVPDQVTSLRGSDAQFVALLDAFRGSGGLYRGEHLAALLTQRQQGDHASLARQIVAGELLAFQWSDTFWIPAFQFSGFKMLPEAGALDVILELGSAFHGWEMAQWFAAPNAWLCERAPVDLLATDLPAVRDAARADRFVAVG